MPPKSKLEKKYPPSPSCTCEICISFCIRPGWWTPEEAELALDMGYAGRMMLEISPDMKFGVLSPAFQGNGGKIAMKMLSSLGCNFLVNDRCELYESGIQPLECRVCHHDRPGMGKKCHLDIENEWNTPYGHLLISRWRQEVNF